MAQWNCGPRNCSGLSAENIVACEPLSQLSRRFDGSYRGLFHGGQMRRIPLSPSISTSRASAAERATIAPRLPGIAFACALANSQIARLLPNPRPASSRKMRQSPSGGNCFSRAQKRQS